MIKYFALYILLGLAIISGSSTVAEAKASKKAVQSEDLKNLNKARKLYGQNKLVDAIEHYEKVSKTSDYWVESVEEKAWAYTRQKDYNKALAALKSIFNPVFAPFIGPETYVLSAYLDLRICNYKGAFDKIALFKAEMLPRVEALEDIVNNPKSEFATHWVNRFAKEQITSSEQLGKDLTKLPRYIQKETRKITHNRLKQMAQADLKEIKKNLNKLKIIEVEVAQRSFVYEKPEKTAKLKFDKRRASDILIFPDEQGSGEVWLDEIGKYEVRTTRCNSSGDKS